MSSSSNETVTDQSTPKDYEYIRVEVSRSETTDVYLKVPVGWRPSGRDHKILKEAVRETVQDYEWDNCGWRDALEMQGYKPVDQEEAAEFEIFDATKMIHEENERRKQKAP